MRALSRVASNQHRFEGFFGPERDPRRGTLDSFGVGFLRLSLRNRAAAFSYLLRQMLEVLAFMNKRHSFADPIICKSAPGSTDDTKCA